MQLTNYPITITDQLGFTLTLEKLPLRIISLVPSITITLFDLGLENRIVGRTKFCIHPSEEVKTIPIIGGTKNLRIASIRKLQPDLIIANKEENEQSQIETLKQHCKVWISDVKDLNSNYEMIEQLGLLTDTAAKASKINAEIKSNFASVINFNQQTVAYFIWRKPYMVAGKDTFINHLLERLNLKNEFKAIEGRYPEINSEQLKSANPNFIFLSSEPYPFKLKHIEELKAIVPSAKIILVDGELFSWFGSKMVEAPVYFNQLQNQLKSL